jgi:cytochrome d ubiquinol oxidase subunit II
MNNKEAINMSLGEIWFVLVAVLFVGFFFLEGFDFGVGMSTRLLARGDSERRVLINTIGPFWDANEVWLITAAGAMFAAFPHWYATLFSGYYVLLTLILLAFIARGVAFEFRAKGDGVWWRKTWDAAIFVGSVVPPFLFGMLFASLIGGMPIDGRMEMNAGFSDYVSGYAILGGVSLTGLCLLHGLTFISLRTMGALRERARKLALRLLPVQALLLAGLVAWSAYATDFFQQRQSILVALTLLSTLALGFAAYFLFKGREGWAFTMTGALMLFMTSSVFIGLFPRLMISSIDPAYDLTVYNAASSPYTLQIMLMVVVILLPFVLAYQAWSYWIFRKRVRETDHLEY